MPVQWRACLEFQLGDMTVEERGNSVAEMSQERVKLFRPRCGRFPCGRNKGKQGNGTLSSKWGMDMFGGLTKKSSRIAIAAALGLVVGGFAFKATPARAADLGGDCCADLEERVAELEATTVRKGNKKVSVTLSGWVVKSFNWWDDGDIDSAIVGDKGYDLGSRFAITGNATIAPGWSAGFNLTVPSGGDLFSVSSHLVRRLHQQFTADAAPLRDHY